MTVALDLSSILNTLVVAMGGVVVWFLRGIYVDFRSVAREVGEHRTQIALLNARLEVVCGQVNRHSDLIDDHTGFLQSQGYRLRDDLRKARQEQDE